MQIEYLTDHYNEIIFISSFTVKPEKEIIDDYLQEFSNKVLKDVNNLLLISGRQTIHIDSSKLSDKISVFDSTKDVLNSLDNYKQQVG